MSITSVDITPAGMEQAFHAYRYFAQALDPIHIGTGGERLSCVDMAIVREAGTDLPKLPGTSLSGACRAYAALQRKENELGRNCAGQGGEKQIVDGKEVKQHCGEKNCLICQTFGFAKGGDVGGKKGSAQFADAHIVAFPVAATTGPLWVTSSRALAHINDQVTAPVADKIAMQGVKPEQTIALGWLALQGSQDFTIPTNLSKGLALAGITKIALVSDAIFTTIVNDNLEVRTSVAIDPGTGAAEDGALFTYEAIPSGTLFAFDVTYQGEKRDEAKITVETGFDLFAWLGVGGMNTRGMGRLRVLEAK